MGEKYRWIDTPRPGDLGGEAGATARVKHCRTVTDGGVLGVGTGEKKEDPEKG